MLSLEAHKIVLILEKYLKYEQSAAELIFCDQER